MLYTATALVLLLFANRFVTKTAWRWRLLLIALPLVFFGPQLLMDRVVAPVDLPYGAAPLAGLAQEHGILRAHNFLFGDLYTQIVPWREAVRSDIAARRWPIWNRHVLAGELLAGAAQPAAYSPFTLIALLIPAAKSFTFSAAITLFLAGLGALLFARELGCRDIVGVITAAGWMFSTSIAFFVLWPLGASWALLPAALLAARRVALAPSIAAAALFAGTFAVLVLQGHPETVFHVSAVAAAYFVFCLFTNRRQIARAIATATAGSIVAALVCALYLLPLLEAIPQTREHAYRTDVWAKMPRGIPIERALARVATNVFPFLHARKWAHPAIGQVNLETMAVGGILVALAVYGASRVRNREVLFLCLLFLFALAAQIEQRPFERVMQHLPLFDVALNARFAFAGGFAIVMTAALGLESALTRQRDLLLPAIVTVTFVLLAAGTLWIEHAGVVVGDSLPWARWRVAGDLIPLFAAATVLWMRLPPRAIGAAVLLLVVAQRWTCDGRTYPSIAASAAYPHIPLLDRIDRRSGPFRVTGVGQAFPPGTSTFYDLEDVRGYEPMLHLGYVRTYPLWSAEQPVWFNKVDDLTRPFLSFLNVRYAIAAADVAVPPGWSEVTRDHGAVLLENSNVIPRVFVPAVVRLGRGEEQTMFEMLLEKNFAERAWIAADKHPHDRDNGRGSLTLHRRGTDYRIAAVMERDGWIVISEPAWKGWRAYVDGNAVRPQIANVAFLAVFVPAGAHDVRLTYRPQSFVTGRAITLLTLASLVLAAFGLRRRRPALNPG